MMIGFHSGLSLRPSLTKTFIVSRRFGLLFTLHFTDLRLGLPRGRFLRGLPIHNLCVKWSGSVFLRAVPGYVSRCCAFEA